MTMNIKTGVFDMSPSIDAAIKSTLFEPKVSSSIVLPDPGVLHHAMDGNLSADSPKLLFINDVFTNLHIWDPTIAVLKERCPQHCFLRYGTPGYTTDSLGTSKPVTLALLVSDIQFLLETLQIPHVLAIIGVEYGGNIGLELSSQHPSIASTFIGTGFAVPNSSVLPRNTAVDILRPRSSLARSFGMGITAVKAVARWFTVDTRGVSEWTRVRYMVAAGSVEGIERLSNVVVECVRRC